MQMCNLIIYILLCKFFIYFLYRFDCLNFILRILYYGFYCEDYLMYSIKYLILQLIIQILLCTFHYIEFVVQISL